MHGGQNLWDFHSEVKKMDGLQINRSQFQAQPTTQSSPVLRSHINRRNILTTDNYCPVLKL